MDRTAGTVHRRGRPARLTAPTAASVSVSVSVPATAPVPACAADRSPATAGGPPGAGGALPGEEDDRGSAIVEFILVGTLLLFLILGIIQVGLVLHVRNVLAADAAEGARHAANFGVPASDGGPYAQALIARTIPGRADAVCTAAAVDGPDGTPLVEITCHVAVPLVLVPLGKGVTITVSGHALKEQP